MRLWKNDPWESCKRERPWCSWERTSQDRCEFPEFPDSELTLTCFRLTILAYRSWNCNETDGIGEGRYLTFVRIFLAILLMLVFWSRRWTRFWTLRDLQHQRQSLHRWKQGCHDGRDVMWRKRHKPSWRYGQFVKYDGPFKNRHICDGLWRFATALLYFVTVWGHRSTVMIVKSSRNFQVKYSVFKELTIFASLSILTLTEILRYSTQKLVYWFS